MCACGVCMVCVGVCGCVCVGDVGVGVCVGVRMSNINAK